MWRILDFLLYQKHLQKFKIFLCSEYDPDLSQNVITPFFDQALSPKISERSIFSLLLHHSNNTVAADLCCYDDLSLHLRWSVA